MDQNNPIVTFQTIDDRRMHSIRISLASKSDTVLRDVEIVLVSDFSILLCASRIQDKRGIELVRGEAAKYFQHHLLEGLEVTELRQVPNRLKVDPFADPSLCFSTMYELDVSRKGDVLARVQSRYCEIFNLEEAG